MADAVHANLEDLKRLQNAVDIAEQEVNEALKKLQRTLDRADWKDRARQDFESKLKTATTSVRQTTNRLDELKPILKREIQALETYLQRG